MKKRFRVAFVGNHGSFSPPIMRALAQLPNAELVAVGTAAPGRHWRLPPRLQGLARSLITAAFAHLPERLWRALPPHARTVAREGARLLRGRGRLVLAGNVNDPHFVAQLRRARADLIIVAGLNQIFRAPTLEALPPMINVHPSLLPTYRGANPAFWQIRNNERRSGVTMHRIDAGIDTGPMLLQKPFPISAWMNPADLMHRAAQVTVDMLPELLARATDPAPPPLAPVGESSYFGYPSADDYQLRLGWDVQTALSAARAAAPAQSLFVYVDSSFWASRTPGQATQLREAAGPGVVRVRLEAGHPNFGAMDGAAGTLTYESPDSYCLQLRDGTLTFRSATPDA